MSQAIETRRQYQHPTTYICFGYCTSRNCESLHTTSHRGLQRCPRTRFPEQETRAILRLQIRTQTHRKTHRQSHVYIYGFGFPAGLRGDLFTRRQRLRVERSQQVRTEDTCRWLPEVGWVLHWPRMAMNLITQYGLQYTATVHTPVCTHTSCVARTCRLSVVHWSDSS